MEIDRNIFRAYDIRGIFPKQINTALYEKIGYVIGMNLKTKKICVCMDGRHSSEELKDALIRGLMCSDVEIIDIGQLPTPLLNYSLKKLFVKNGLMVTASHNPKSYNGLKIVLDDVTLYGDAIQKIYHDVEKVEEIPIERRGNLKNENDILSYYISEIKEKFRILEKLKVCIDCSNGVTGHVARNVLNEFDIDFTIINEEVDGNFPNHSPDPTKEENLDQLKAEMKKGNCDIGIAFDGDGDRLIVIDGSFNIIWPDQLMMVYSKTLLSKKIGKVVFDVKCSDNLEKIILDMGGTPIRSRTGHSYIKKSLIKNNALLAGEMSGHIFFNDGWYGFDDGIFAAITLLEIVSKEKNPKKAFDWLPASFSTPEINIEFRENEHFDFFKLFVKLNSFEDAVIDDLDGLRIIYPNGWALIRCSNTSSNIVLRFEANDEKMLNNIKNIIRDAILKVNSSITIPF